MKKILVFSILMVLILFGCDRYKHDFTTEPDNQITTQQFFENFKSILTRLDTTNVDTIMTFYSDDYLNDGQTKDDMKNFYNSLLSEYNFNQLNIELLSLEDYSISFRISLLSKADTLFSEIINDVLSKRDNSYLFIGNQEMPESPTKQKVMVILFTGTRCQNCPYAEEALEELKAEIPNKFCYAEFHRYPADPLELPFCRELFQFYGLSGVPQAIFQGDAIYGHFHNNTADYYRDFINHYAEMDAKVILDSLTYTISDFVFNGRVKLTFLDNNLENLKLISVLVEKDSEVLNYNHEHCKQVVYAYSATEIQPINGFVDFNIGDLPETIPDDSQVIIWAQSMRDNFIQNETNIYNVLEVDISI